MKLVVLFSAFLLPAVSLADDPSPLLADDGRDLSFLLKRYDGPVPILRRAVKGTRHIVPRSLQVEEVPVRRAPNGLVKRQQCLDPGSVRCPGSAQCCPIDSVCGPNFCCPSGNLVCKGVCKNRFLVSSSFSSLTHKSSFRLPRCPRIMLPEHRMLPSWSCERMHSTNDKANL
jgi:hypothetical protein